MTQKIKTKTCSRCKEEKEPICFGSHPRMASGLQSYCRQCANEKKRIEYLRNPNASRSYSSQYYHQNKDCQDRKAKKRVYDREYRKRNSAKLDKMKSEWIAKNKPLVNEIKRSYKARRRAQEKAGSSTAEVAAWIAKQKMVCYWCSATCQDSFHVDHYVPLSKGGLHEVDNLVVACPSCNLSKSARDPYEFAAARGRLF